MSAAAAVEDGDDPAARAASARVRAVRAYLRERSPGPSLREVLGRIAYQVYVTALFGGLWGAAVASALSQPPSATPAEVPAAATTAVPAIALGLAVLLTITGVRIGTWAGPVLVSRPEAALLLPAPLDRRLLLRRNLGVGLAGYGAIGAVVGLLLGAVVAVEARTGAAGTIVGTTVAWAALGVATGAGALWIESSRRLARGALRGTPVLVAVGAGLVWLAVALPAVAAWTTPWGWASTPVTVAVGAGVPMPWLPPVLAIVLAAVAVVGAVGRLPALPDEELVRRAGTASGVRASAAMFDARAIAQARRSGQQWLVGVRRVRIRRPRHRWLLVVWRDLVSLLRRPGTVERTVSVVVGAAALVAWASGGAAAVVGAVLLASVTAGQLLEPLRVELEDPVIGELTPFTALDVALEHLVVPVASLGLSGAATAVLLAVVGVLPWPAVPAALVGAAALAVLLAAAAGLTSTRGAPPLQWLVQGDAGVFLLVGWMLAGPVLAVVLAAPLGLVVVSALQDGQAPMAAVARSAVVAVVLAAVLAALTRWRVRRRTGG